MPPAPAQATGRAAAPAAGAAPAAAQPKPPQNYIWTIARVLLLWWFIRNFFGQRQNLTKLKPEERLVPKYQDGYPLDVAVYLSESPSFPLRKHWNNPEYLIWEEQDVLIGQVNERTFQYDFMPSQMLQNNGSLFLHIYFHPSGSSMNPADEEYDLNGTFSRTHNLVAYKPRPKVKAAQNLLKGGSASQPDEQLQEDMAETPVDTTWWSLFKPNVSIALVSESSVHAANAVPPWLSPHLVVDDEQHNYYPVVFFNEFWLLREHLIPLNSTVDSLRLSLTLHGMASFKFMMYNQMEESFKMQMNFGAMADGESDTFKRVLSEGNPYFLGLTGAVSLLHSVFDVLAFKNDIGFWRGKKNVEGLSVRTILLNAFCQIIVFLYLLDNDTSFVILASSGVGLLIEFWKITRAMDVSIDRSGSIPRLRFKDKASYTSTHTKEYDAQAFKYLSWALYPLVLCYAIYALLYETHKSWYSWIVNSLVGAVYTFGFLSMTPQLFLNYKLKSVAHLPWRQMSYKFLNTIIDDLFAFVIKMPTLHRLSVFRDDLVFLVYLYQRWIYRVDKRRANEFGYSEQAPTEAVEGAAGEASAAAPSAQSVPAVEGKAGAQPAQGEEALRRRRLQEASQQPASSQPLTEAELLGKKGK